MSAVTLGDLLGRARSHLEAATGLAGTAQPSESVIAAARLTGDLALGLSRYLDDIAPYSVDEAITRNDLERVARAAVDAREAMKMAAESLRGGDVEHDVPAGEPPDPLVAHLAASAALLSSRPGSAAYSFRHRSRRVAAAPGLGRRDHLRPGHSGAAGRGWRLVTAARAADRLAVAAVRTRPGCPRTGAPGPGRGVSLAADRFRSHRGRAGRRPGDGGRHRPDARHSGQPSSRTTAASGWRDGRRARPGSRRQRRAAAHGRSGRRARRRCGPRC